MRLKERVEADKESLKTEEASIRERLTQEKGRRNTEELAKDSKD